MNGRLINLLLTHLDPYDKAMRLTQAKDALRWASGFAENRILSGDMNAWPDQIFEGRVVEINPAVQAQAYNNVVARDGVLVGALAYLLYGRGAPRHLNWTPPAPLS